MKVKRINRPCIIPDLSQAHFFHSYFPFPVARISREIRHEMLFRQFFMRESPLSASCLGILPHAYFLPGKSGTAGEGREGGGKESDCSQWGILPSAVSPPNAAPHRLTFSEKKRSRLRNVRVSPLLLSTSATNFGNSCIRYVIEVIELLRRDRHTFVGGDGGEIFLRTFRFRVPYLARSR